MQILWHSIGSLACNATRGHILLVPPQGLMLVIFISVIITVQITLWLVYYGKDHKWRYLKHSILVFTLFNDTFFSAEVLIHEIGVCSQMVTGGRRKPWPIWGPYCSIWMEKLRQTTWMFSQGSWCLLLNNLLGTLPLESESQTCMFWGAHTVERTIYGCRIHSHAFIQPFLYEVSELVSLTVNSFECPR